MKANNKSDDNKKKPFNKGKPKGKQKDEDEETKGFVEKSAIKENENKIDMLGRNVSAIK
jgi:hypothetical protein